MCRYRARGQQALWQTVFTPILIFIHLYFLLSQQMYSCQTGWMGSFNIRYYGLFSHSMAKDDVPWHVYADTAYVRDLRLTTIFGLRATPISKWYQYKTSAFVQWMVAGYFSALIVMLNICLLFFGMKWTMEFTPKCIKWGTFMYVGSFLLNLCWIPFYYYLFDLGHEVLAGNVAGSKGAKQYYMACPYGWNLYFWTFGMLLHSFNVMVAFGLYGEARVFIEESDSESEAEKEADELMDRMIEQEMDKALDKSDMKEAKKMAKQKKGEIKAAKNAAKAALEEAAEFERETATGKGAEFGKGKKKGKGKK